MSPDWKCVIIIIVIVILGRTTTERGGTGKGTLCGYASYSHLRTGQSPDGCFLDKTNAKCAIVLQLLGQYPWHVHTYTHVYTHTQTHTHTHTYTHMRTHTHTSKTHVRHKADFGRSEHIESMLPVSRHCMLCPSDY